MSKGYQFTFNSSAEDLIEKAKGAAAKNGVAFKGDASKGGFSGMGIVGEYVVKDSVLHVEIKQKPIFMTWGLIEKSLKDFFSEA